MTTPTREALVEAIKRVICKSRTCEGIHCCQWPAQGGRTQCPVRDGGYDDAAEDVVAFLSAFAKEHGLKLLEQKRWSVMHAAAPSFPWDGGQSEESKDG